MSDLKAISMNMFGSDKKSSKTSPRAAHHVVPPPTCGVSAKKEFEKKRRKGGKYGQAMPYRTNVRGSRMNNWRRVKREKAKECKVGTP